MSLRVFHAPHFIINICSYLIMHGTSNAQVTAVGSCGAVPCCLYSSKLLIAIHPNMAHFRTFSRFHVSESIEYETPLAGHSQYTKRVPPPFFNACTIALIFNCTGTSTNSTGPRGNKPIHPQEPKDFQVIAWSFRRTGCEHPPEMPIQIGFVQ
jgi:hypothetical protein